MRLVGGCGPKSPLMIGSLVIFELYLGLWMTSCLISFCLSPSAVIQFLEGSYLFRLDNQIGMSLCKLIQYHHAVSISKASI